MAKINVRNSILKNGEHYLTSDYKTRNENRGKHNGMDFVGPNGVDDIIAIEKGKVTYVGYDSSGGGYWLGITTNGIEHRYFHLAKDSILVKVGDSVEKGQIIARMGKSGNATNYNVHFAIYNKGYKDPLPYLMNEDPFHINDNIDSYKKFIIGVQEALGANVDGIAGVETLNKTITISTSKNWNHPVVRVLQEYLVSLGYNLGKYGVDGKFGSDMKKVIMDYQKNVAGLSGKYVDGVITAKMYTWKKLLKLS